MHDCASILDSISKGITLFPRFLAWYIPSLVIHSMISALVFDDSRKPSYAHAYNVHATC